MIIHANPSQMRPGDLLMLKKIDRRFNLIPCDWARISAIEKQTYSWAITLGHFSAFRKSTEYCPVWREDARESLEEWRRSIPGTEEISYDRLRRRYRGRSTVTEEGLIVPQFCRDENAGLIAQLSDGPIYI